MAPRPSFDDHEKRCANELRQRGFRADDPRIADECRCNASFWSASSAANEGLDAQLRHDQLAAQVARDADAG